MAAAARFARKEADAQLRGRGENDRPVRTASSEQVRRPINRDGIDQWRHYAPWLDPLKVALGPVLDAYPDVTFPARVIATIPSADRSRATVRVRIGFDQLDPRILPEMAISVRFLDQAG